MNLKGTNKNEGKIRRPVLLFYENNLLLSFVQYILMTNSFVKHQTTKADFP